MTTELQKLQSIARKHLNCDSARVCLTRSVECWDDNRDYISACEQALWSILFSIGVFHPDYDEAKTLMSSARKKAVNE